MLIRIGLSAEDVHSSAATAMAMAMAMEKPFVSVLFVLFGLFVPLWSVCRHIIHTYTAHIYTIHMLVTNCCQILKRASEGITERDGAGRTADGAFDLHRPRWIKS